MKFSIAILTAVIAAVASAHPQAQAAQGQADVGQTEIGTDQSASAQQAAAEYGGQNPVVNPGREDPAAAAAAADPQANIKIHSIAGVEGGSRIQFKVPKLKPYPVPFFPPVDFNQGILGQYAHLLQDPLTPEQSKFHLIQPNFAWPTDDCVLGMGQAMIWAAARCATLSAWQEFIMNIVSDLTAIEQCVMGITSGSGLQSCMFDMSFITKLLCESGCPNSVIPKVTHFITTGCAADIAANNIPIVLLQSSYAAFDSVTTVICASNWLGGEIEECFDDLLEDIFTYWFKYQHQFNLKETFNGTEARALLNGSYIAGFWPYAPKSFLCSDCVANIFDLFTSISLINITGSMFVNNFKEFGDTCGYSFIDGIMKNVKIRGLPNKVIRMQLEHIDIIHQIAIFNQSNVGRFINNTRGGGAGQTPWVNSRDNVLKRFRGFLKQIQSARREYQAWLDQPIGSSSIFPRSYEERRSIDIAA